MDVVLRRDGGRVTGAYSFGAGFGRIDGEVVGDTLDYRWTMGADSGRGRLVVDGTEYRDSWGLADAHAGGGEIIVTAP